MDGKSGPKGKRGGFALLAGAATILLPVSASAQDPGGAADRLPEPSPITPGASVDGSLSEGDPRRADRYYDSYRLRLGAGESIQVELTSSAFDPYLDLAAAAEPEESLRENDDGIPDTLNARLRFTAPAAGDYLLRAQGLEGGTGPYRLTVARRTVPPPPRPIPLVAGTDVTGKLDATSPELEDGQRYALYQFDGAAGARVRIDMLAEGFDPAVKLAGGEDGAFGAEDDDGGDGLNARLWTVLPASGRYTVTARSVNDKEGSYALTLHLYPPRAGPPAPSPLRRHAPILDRLDPADAAVGLATDDSGAVSYFYRLYAFPVKAGETVTIDLRSEDFDPVLDAGVMSSLGFAVAQTNDDHEGTNARLVLKPTETGTVYLRARSLNTGGSGDYTLSVSSVGSAPPPRPR